MNKGELARDFFMEGYNCTQAVVIAFKDELGLSQSQAARVGSGFGGGMGRLREVCGTVSGMVLVLSMLYGYDAPDAPEDKLKLYERVRELAGQFSQKEGSIICRELLGGMANASVDAPATRDAQYYATRPCARLAYLAAELTQAFIEKNPIGEG